MAINTPDPVQKAAFGPASPFLIVRDITASIAHYVDKLGFDLRFLAPPSEPFFAIVGRGTAQVMLKAFSAETPPIPNSHRHPDARWDVFILVDNPDALRSAWEQQGVALRRPPENEEDGLQGFEVTDPDGYVCYFGRPG